MASASSSTTTPTPRCLVRGSINIDEFFALPHIVRPGETISSTSLTKKAGGKGANQAYAVARAGGKVDLDGCIGQDGEWVREFLKEGGVGDERLKTLEDELTGRAIIQSAPDGENSIVLHAGANYHLPPKSSSSASAPDIQQYTHILLQNEIPLSSTLAYLTEAGSRGLTSIFNPSPMLSPEELRKFPWNDLSWLIVNEGELNDLLEAFKSDSTASGITKKKVNTDELTLEELIKIASKGILELHENEYFSRGIGIICTLGSKGILYFDTTTTTGKKEIGHMPAGQLVNKLKDTTGAGDCFTGYFVAGLMRGVPLKKVVNTCLTACAICVENEGAMESIPDQKAVLARLA
ncbi:ribokinase [Kwoniella dejecticola CBS 10117]|uniref:Ribokinase n=1 Tax=Kwoniella dejecticola CBS 10117 TaxID=1296121 RepID=A0A1A5ZXL7_9TREE|nr:ribokinase [Kwoniella dejecticola CBS 10117]OBR82549.1 ribokinase [Kwoniella dejecticola CBS 10117]